MEQFILLQLSGQEIKLLISDAIKEEFKKITPPSEPTKDMVLLSKKEAAKFLSISLTTLSTYVKQDLIRPWTLGPLIRFSKDELEKCLKSNSLKNRRSHGR